MDGVVDGTVGGGGVEGEAGGGWVDEEGWWECGGSCIGGNCAKGGTLEREAAGEGRRESEGSGRGTIFFAI
jgi:hypothetical protein